MPLRPAATVALVPLVLVAAAAGGSAQTAPPEAPAAPTPYVLTLGDVMNTLVQPRHAKLGLAGRARNWPLAAYALAELRQAFAGIAKAQPRYRGLPVADLIDAAMSQPTAAVDAAIKLKDTPSFTSAYAQFTQGCNACHATVDHPFVVIKAPDASAFPNQDFDSAR
jgi:hypothetical protein